MFPGGYQWNPLRKPCTRDCKNPLGESYCWTKRFKRSPNLPEWDEKELVAPFHRKKGTDILVCWMTDLMLMGNYEQIQSILDVCNTSPQHRFFFLTKSPERYADFNFPENCWLGCSINADSEKLLDNRFKLNNPIFLSIEPFYGEIPTKFLVKLGSFDCCGDCIRWDWIFVGPETKGNSHTPNRRMLPKKEWLLCIQETCQHYGIKLWEKDVLKTSGLLEKLIQERPF